MGRINSVAVFCGASLGNLPVWQEAGTELGEGLAKQKLRLIYGGGSIGLMGVIANAALSKGGSVVGVIPDFLKRREVAHQDLANLEVTETMHERKLRMFELCDAFITFAGGLGTLDETFEILTWRQLGLHDKPIFICDVAGSARGLLIAIEHTIAMGFARPDIRELFEVIDGVGPLLARLTRAQP